MYMKCNSPVMLLVCSANEGALDVAEELKAEATQVLYICTYMGVYIHVQIYIYMCVCVCVCR